MKFVGDSIKNTIMKIEGSEMYLPAIQRRFVWKKEKIEILFDSLIKDYPIGTFLFWELKKEETKNYVFYEFLKKYDSRNPYNEKKNGEFLKDNIIGVLDGQQRLSAFYLGLQGTHTEKLKHKRINNDDAYPETTLYINLLSLPYYEVKTDMGSALEISTEEDFEFKFLTKENSEVIIKDEKYSLWFKVGQVLSWSQDPEIDEIYHQIITSLNIESNHKYIEQINISKRKIKKFLGVLYNRLCRDEIINYFPIRNNDLEYVLEIFIRVNSGASILSKTDLMFSTIVATWDDGREKIERFIKKLNKKGEGFSFDNDFLMRSCLVLCDLKVLFKVTSFKSDNVKQIKSSWNDIENALNKTVDILVSFGFSDSRLTSNNAIIIIAYYFMKGGNESIEDKESIRKYLLHALIKNIYGGQGDQVISALRNEIRIEDEYTLKSKTFPDFTNIKLPSNKTFKINSEDIEEFLSYKKGSKAFHLLLLLYPNIKFTEVSFHQDHIHPDSGFSRNELQNIGITDEDKIKEWIEKKDTLPNLQLMEGIQNISKNKTPFSKWFENKVEDKDKFRKDNYIPDTALGFSNFETFYNERQDLIRIKLHNILINSF